jgi:dihydroorotate dehydrogenase
VGGIRSLTQVLNFLGAGASLVQLYTGLVYEGPFLIRQICKDLSRYLSEEGVRSVSDLRGEKSMRRLPNSLAVKKTTDDSIINLR